MKPKRIMAVITATAVIAAISIGLMPYKFVCLPVFTSNAADIVASGECGVKGDNIVWQLDSEGTLTISGEGAMPEWETAEDIPWFGCEIVNVVIEDRVTTVGPEAFMNCINLKSISLPGSITKICKSAFLHCNSLTEIKIPSSVVDIEDMAFFRCESLAEITIPEGVKSIGYMALGKNTSLTSIKLPESLTDIGEDTFAYCENLKAIEIPNSVRNISIRAFYGCKNLTSVTLSESVASIGNTAFGLCDSLSKITIKNPKCVIEDATVSIPETAAIHGCLNSTAQAYAEKYNRKFVALEEKTSKTELGDINGDSTIDSSDASLVLAEYAKIQTGGAGEFTDIQFKAADVNNDGVVDATDASKILAYYAMISTGKEPIWD